MKKRPLIIAVIVAMVVLACLSPVRSRAALAAALTIPGLGTLKNALAETVAAEDHVQDATLPPLQTEAPLSFSPKTTTSVPVPSSSSATSGIPATPAPSTAAQPNSSSPVIPSPKLSSRSGSAAGSLTGYGALQTRVNQYLSSQHGHYALYFQDLNTGRGFGINQNEVMNAASTIKVPVVLYLYNQAAAGRINLSEQVVYTEDDQEAGSGTIYYTHQPGASFSLAELANASLSISDNVAINMLIRRLGMDNINNFCRSLGADVVWNGQNVTSARSMAIYLQAIMDLAKRSPLGQRMIDQMTNTAPMDRIAGELPSSITIAHKHGNNDGVVNDVGIVFLAGHPYTISLLSQEVDYNEATAVLAHVSKMVYDDQVSH